MLMFIQRVKEGDQGAAKSSALLIAKTDAAAVNRHRRYRISIILHNGPAVVDVQCKETSRPDRVARVLCWIMDTQRADNHASCGAAAHSSA